MIKAIIFDCFGVLATDVWLAFCDQLPQSSDLARAKELNRAFDRGIISRDEFMAGVKEATGQLPPDIERMDMAKNIALLSYIAELKGQYKIGLLSNISSDWITRVFLSEAEHALFDTTVFSYEVGLAKPDPAIYELVCTRLGVQPDEAIMIDDREGYVVAACEIGMKGITYQDFHQMRSELEQLTSI